MSYQVSIERAIHDAIEPVGIIPFTDALDAHYIQTRSYQEIRAMSGISDTIRMPENMLNSKANGFRRGGALAILFAHGYLTEDKDIDLANTIHTQSEEMLFLVPDEYYDDDINILAKESIRMQIRHRANKNFIIDQRYSRAIGPYCTEITQYRDLFSGIFTGLHFTLDCVRRNQNKLPIASADTVRTVSTMLFPDDNKIETELQAMIDRGYN